MLSDASESPSETEEPSPNDTQEPDPSEIKESGSSETEESGQSTRKRMEVAIVPTGLWSLLAPTGTPCGCKLNCTTVVCLRSMQDSISLHSRGV